MRDRLANRARQIFSRRLRQKVVEQLVVVLLHDAGDLIEIRDHALFVESLGFADDFDDPVVPVNLRARAAVGQMELVRGGNFKPF